MAYTKLDEWSKNHHRFLSLYASIVASLAIDSPEYLKFIKNKSYLRYFYDIPPLETWLQFYRHFSFSIDLISLLIDENGLFSGILFDDVKRIQRFDEVLMRGVEGKSNSQTSEIKEEFEKCLDIAENFQSSHFKELGNLLESSKDDDFKIFQIPEVRFLITVYAPCQLFYGLSPEALFKKAQDGCIESIDKMLRLDPSVLGDRKIAEYFYRAFNNEDRTDYNTIINALQKPPKGKIDIQKLKYKFAGLIMLVSELFEDKLTAPEVEKLFNALADDQNIPELKLLPDDSDAITPDSIARHIRIEKEILSNLIVPAKK